MLLVTRKRFCQFLVENRVPMNTSVRLDLAGDTQIEAEDRIWGLTISFLSRETSMAPSVSGISISSLDVSLISKVCWKQSVLKCSFSERCLCVPRKRPEVRGRESLVLTCS